MTSLILEITVEVKAKASSSFTKEDVERRLSELYPLEGTNKETDTEIDFLLRVKKKKGWE